MRPIEPDHQADEASSSMVDDPVSLPGFGDDDALPPHFGAARLGIP